MCLICDFAAKSTESGFSVNIVTNKTLNTFCASF